jgi:hypothetical protein
MPLRTLSLKPLTDISEIWNEAEKRLKANRFNFSLVYDGSHYLPTSGFLPKLTQLFEIRWQGRGGKPKAIKQRQLVIDWFGLHHGVIQWEDTVEVAIWKWATKDRYILSRQNKIVGGYFASQKFERPTNITVREFFEGIDPENWGFYIEGPSWQENYRLLAEEVFMPPREEEIPEEPQDPALIDTGDLPWIDPKDRGIITTPHYDSPSFAADFTDGEDFKPKKNEQSFKLKVSINGKPPVTRDAYQRESILQWLAIQGEILDEKTSISGGKDVRTQDQLEIKFQDYFKGIPMTERTLYISNPTDLGFVRRRPRANPSLLPAPGASLGQTMPPPFPTCSPSEILSKETEETQPASQVVSLSSERILYISNPTDLGYVRRRPRANPSLPPAPGASLGQTTPPNLQHAVLRRKNQRRLKKFSQPLKMFYCLRTKL